jgi:hypothetical protein
MTEMVFFLTQWGSEQRAGGNGTLKAATAIAIDSNDNIYVLSEHTSEVQKFRIFSPTSNDFECTQENTVALGICFLTKWNSYGNRGLAVDSQGNVYVAAWSKIKKYSPDGVFLKEFGDVVTDPTGHRTTFTQISEVTIDKDDHVYVSAVNCGWIIKYNSEGGFVKQWGSYAGYTLSHGSGSCHFSQ